MAKLYIRTSNESLEEWDKERIVSALIRETYLDRRTAEVISNEVEKQIIGLDVNILTSTLIRELVGAKLIELGLQKAHKMHMKLGVPLYDVEQIILHQSAHSQAGFPLGPELINLALASRIKREYALINVFSQEVTDAHLRGDIYLEGLEFIDRLYCVGLSPEYLKKFGLNLPEGALTARPPKHPEALISQLVGFTEILRGHFCYSVEWDALNTLFAPYTEGLSNVELKQLAQKLVFEVSRQSVILQVPILLNLYWHIPDDLAGVAVSGASRKTRSPKTKTCYGDYLAESQRVLMAILEVLSEGDGEGKIFTLPLPIIHVSDDALQKTAGTMEFLGKFADFLINKGHASLILERGEGRRVFRSFVVPHKTITEPGKPWLTRHAVIHNVVINLPRFGYIAHGSDLHLFARLTEMMELVAEAHMQKRVFIEKLLAAGKEGPLGILMMKQDGKSFLRLEEADFLISLSGLNELVQLHKGAQLHESEEAVNFGLEIISHMQSMCERLSQRHHISFVLSGFPHHAVSSRLARLDLRYYSPDSGHVVKGDVGTGTVYYTNAIYMNPDAVHNGAYSILDRMKTEGKFARYLPGGTISWVPVEGNFSHKKSLLDFISAVFRDTENTHIYFTPDNSANLFHFLR